MYNDQTVFPYYWCLGLSYKDGNSKIIYYFFWLLVVFTFSMLISEGFMSLISALETFRAPNWKNFLNIKLINDYNIKVLVKYKKLGAAKCFSLPGKVIMGFKECSSLIAKTLIMCKIGEDQ